MVVPFLRKHKYFIDIPDNKRQAYIVYINNYVPHAVFIRAGYVYSTPGYVTRSRMQ